jgi:hypothetical protein
MSDTDSDNMFMLTGAEGMKEFNEVMKQQTETIGVKPKNIFIDEAGTIHGDGATILEVYNWLQDQGREEDK